MDLEPAMMPFFRVAMVPFEAHACNERSDIKKKDGQKKRWWNLVLLNVHILSILMK